MTRCTCLSGHLEYATGVEAVHHELKLNLNIFANGVYLYGNRSFQIADFPVKGLPSFLGTRLRQKFLYKEVNSSFVKSYIKHQTFISNPIIEATYNRNRLKITRVFRPYGRLFIQARRVEP